MAQTTSGPITGNTPGLRICGPNDCDCIYGAGTSQAAQCKKQMAANPGGISAGVDTQAIAEPLAAIFRPFFAALPALGIRVALFMFALMLLIIGLWILTRNPAADAGSALSTGLNKAAVGIGKRVVGRGRK